MSAGQVRRVLAPNPGPFTLEGTNTWIVGGGRDAAVVIDPGPEDERHLSAVAEAAGTVAAILLTHHHPDHAPGARPLSAMTGAAVFAFGPEPGEERLRDGDLVPGPAGRLRALHTPGHTPDHVVFLAEGTGSMFTGDAVLGRGTSVIDPPEGDLGEYLASLRRMQDLDPTILYPGHGPIVRDAGGKLREYLAHRQRRERQVLAGLADGARTATELVPPIYAAYPPELHPAATRSVLAHLLKLERDGRVIRVGVDARTNERFALADPSGHQASAPNDLPATE